MLTDLEFISPLYLKHVDGLGCVKMVDQTLKSHFPSIVQNQFKYTDSWGISIAGRMLFALTVLLQALENTSDWVILFYLCHLFILLLYLGG